MKTWLEFLDTETRSAKPETLSPSGHPPPLGICYLNRIYVKTPILKGKGRRTVPPIFPMEERAGGGGGSLYPL